jgi:hypothetical protein
MSSQAEKAGMKIRSFSEEPTFRGQEKVGEGKPRRVGGLFLSQVSRLATMVTEPL